MQSFDVVEDGETKSVGGYARLFSAIKAERVKDSESLLVDAGDYSMGRMGYDVTTFGNHEFDYRPKWLAKGLQAAIDSGENLPEIVASNTIFPTNADDHLTSSLKMLKESMDDYGVSEYTILERSDLIVGRFL